MSGNYSGRVQVIADALVSRYYGFRQSLSRRKQQWKLRGPLYDSMTAQLSGSLLKEVDPSAAQTKAALDGTVQWLLENQKIQPDGGISACVSIENQQPNPWGSYPEVTGYIIPTLYDYADAFNDRTVFDAATRASEFELPFQNEEGWYPGGYVGCITGPSIFNSAQIIQGLVRCHKETGDDRFIDSANKAAQWIKNHQSRDGSWRQYNFSGIGRTYDSTVAWHVLEVYTVTGDESLREAAERNFAWVLEHQSENGWFYNCDNSRARNAEPLTHTIGYTLQGLIEGYKILQLPQLLHSAELGCQSLLHIFERRKFMAGRFNSRWQGTVESTCTTGNAQIAICWLELYQITGNTRYLNAALKLNDQMKNIQFKGIHPLIDGGIPSSYPFDGDYFPHAINSWAIKYFADALLLEYKAKQQVREIGR